jgi:chaperonin cofactor prefoldin
MALVLQPTLAEMTTEELERRIEAVRARRIVAVMEYVAGQQLKLETEKDKVHRKLKAHYEMLAKELDRCDRAIYSLDQRVAAIEMLRQEAGLMERYGKGG